MTTRWVCCPRGRYSNPSFFDPVGQTSFGAGAYLDCDLAAADDGPMGVQGLDGSSCIYDFSSFFNLVMETTEGKIHVDRCFAR
jgi:hypothetical protein